MNIVAKHHQRIMAHLIGMLIVLAFMLHPFPALGLDERDCAQRLTLGIMDTPPFVMETADGQWEGLSIDLWRKVARDLAVEFELVEYISRPQILAAIKTNDIDVVPTAAVTANHEIIVDFSNPIQINPPKE